MDSVFDLIGVTNLIKQRFITDFVNVLIAFRWTGHKVIDSFLSEFVSKFF